MEAVAHSPKFAKKVGIPQSVGKEFAVADKGKSYGKSKKGKWWKTELKMAKLTTKARNALPAAKFAGPDKSYPIPDKAHAANAKARASQQVNKGNMSPAQEKKIDAKANKVLAKGKK